MYVKIHKSIAATWSMRSGLCIIICSVCFFIHSMHAGSGVFFSIIIFARFSDICFSFRFVFDIYSVLLRAVDILCLHKKRERKSARQSIPGWNWKNAYFLSSEQRNISTITARHAYFLSSRFYGFLIMKNYLHFRFTTKNEKNSHSFPFLSGKEHSIQIFFIKAF